jgi:ABC-type enterochelin transport system permease subunit
MLSENTFFEAIVETGRIPFIGFDIPSLITFECGHRLSAAGYDHSLSLFGFAKQRGCLVF